VFRVGQKFRARLAFARDYIPNPPHPAPPASNPSAKMQSDAAGSASAHFMKKPELCSVETSSPGVSATVL